MFVPGTGNPAAEGLPTNVQQGGWPAQYTAGSVHTLGIALLPTALSELLLTSVSWPSAVSRISPSSGLLEAAFPLFSALFSLFCFPEGG